MIQDRTAETFQYHQEIKQPFGNLDQVLDWCRLNCQCAWRWCLVDTSSYLMPGRYEFYFDSDRDACAFALRWS